MTVSDWLPMSAEDLWQRWLGYRYPHYAAMEFDASRTLTGTQYAVVRAGWNGAGWRTQDSHATLFTLRDETPDPAAAATAAAEQKPAGVVFHHVVAEAPSDEHLAPLHPRATGVARQVSAALHARAELDRL